MGITNRSLKNYIRSIAVLSDSSDIGNTKLTAVGKDTGSSSPVSQKP